GRQLLERLDARIVLVTRGSRGMALFERDGASSFIPIHGTDEIADVTGAGDTVISTFSLVLASGGTPLEAASLANVAGGVVVMKRATAPPPPAELRKALGECRGTRGRSGGGGPAGRGEQAQNRASRRPSRGWGRAGRGEPPETLAWNDARRSGGGGRASPGRAQAHRPGKRVLRSVACRTRALSASGACPGRRPLRP